MPVSRRQFLGTAGSVAATALLAPAARSMPVAPDTGAQPPGPYDLTWPSLLTGAHKALFDVAAMESGRGVWRATIWENQYKQHLGIAAADLSSVMVVRGPAIALVMQQRFWDRYGVGKALKVVHPLTDKAIDTNPALLSSTRGEVAAQFDEMALDRYIARGRVALACDLAFREIVDMVAKADGLPAAAARERAVADILPGVKLQPSGIFAVVRAQEAGAQYVRSS